MNQQFENRLLSEVLVENFGTLAVDRDGDYLITENDFAISAKLNGSSEDVARSAFRLLDNNKNGYLDNTELTSANKMLTRLYFDGFTNTPVNIRFIQDYICYPRPPEILFGQSLLECICNEYFFTCNTTYRLKARGERCLLVNNKWTRACFLRYILF